MRAGSRTVHPGAGSQSTLSHSLFVGAPYLVLPPFVNAAVANDRIHLIVAQMSQPNRWEPVKKAQLNSRSKRGVQMKKFLLGSVGLAAMIAGPAMAADMRLAPPPPPVVYYDWSGAYIGFNAGGIWSQVDQTFPNPLLLNGFGPGNGKSFSTSPSDGIFGFHAGAQWQWGAWVLGAEAALSGCFQECRATSGIVSPPGIAPNTFFEHKITNLFTVGPRLGYAWDRVMIYATGGYASADLKGTSCSTVTGICGPAVQHQTAPRATTAGMPAAASTTWSTRARWSTCSSASNINISTWVRRMRSASIPACNPRDGRRL